jgi:hypothetical protein
LLCRQQKLVADLLHSVFHSLLEGIAGSRKLDHASDYSQIGGSERKQIAVGEALGEYLLDQMAMDVGEAVVAKLVAVGEPLVIDSQQIKNRGVQIVHVHSAVDDVVTHVVGLPVNDAGLHTASGQPHRKTARG